jgi:hypothetical protein
VYAKKSSVENSREIHEMSKAEEEEEEAVI